MIFRDIIWEKINKKSKRLLKWCNYLINFQLSTNKRYFMSTNIFITYSELGHDLEIFSYVYYITRRRLLVLGELHGLYVDIKPKAWIYLFTSQKSLSTSWCHCIILHFVCHWLATLSFFDALNSCLFLISI